MPETIRMKPFYLYAPFERVERKDDACVVEGYVFRNEVVRGEGGVRLKRSAMEEATADYMKWAAVREMHGRNAAGTALAIEWDDQGAKLRAKIVDPVARMKVEEGVYKGFSVGVNPQIRRGLDIEKVEWVENSLVDRPKDWDCQLTLARADGFDPEAEVEVTLLDEAEEERAETSERTPSRENLEGKRKKKGEPAGDGDEPDEDDEEDDDENADEAEEDAEDAEDEEKAKKKAAKKAAKGKDDSDEERAAAPAYPDPKENDPAIMPEPPVKDAHIQAPERSLIWGFFIQPEPTGAFSLIGPGGQKLGEFKTREECEARAAEIAEKMKPILDLDGEITQAAEVARAGSPMDDYPEEDEEYADRENRKFTLNIPEHVQNAWHAIHLHAHAKDYSDSELRTMKKRIKAAAKKQGVTLEGCEGDEPEGEDRAEDAELERIIRHEGEKWVLYSHKGKRLGEFDSEEAAQKREREIEYFKHRDERSQDAALTRFCESLDRTEMLEAELAGVREAETARLEEVTLLRANLAAAEERVRVLEQEPVPVAAPVRHIQGIEREFWANLGNPERTERAQWQAELNGLLTADTAGLTSEQKSRMASRINELRAYLR